MEISLAKLTTVFRRELDQCLIEKITPMAWSPSWRRGLIGEGAKRLLPAQKEYRPEKFIPTLEVIAQARGVSRTQIALAWLLKHPAGIVPVIGSINPEHIEAATRAADLELTREEWYLLFKAARGEQLP